MKSTTSRSRLVMLSLSSVSLLRFPLSPHLVSSFVSSFFRRNFIFRSPTLILLTISLFSPAVFSLSLSRYPFLFRSFFISLKLSHSHSLSFSPSRNLSPSPSLFSDVPSLIFFSSLYFLFYRLSSLVPLSLSLSHFFGNLSLQFSSNLRPDLPQCSLNREKSSNAH